MKKWNKYRLYWPVLTGLLLTVGCLCWGSTPLSFSDIYLAFATHSQESQTIRAILLDLRLPAVFTALLAGAALAACGLLMQTVFNNPLADPSILGVSSGASLGVALTTLCTGATFASGWQSAQGYALATLFAWLGAGCVVLLLVVCHSFFRSATAVLISGVMIGFMVSALTAVLSFFATAQGLQSYIAWGLGSFQNVGWNRLALLAALLLAGIALLAFLAKPLNALLLGEAYAQNAGFRVRRIRFVVLMLTALMTATVTVYCGPISFIGLFVPHAVRFMLRSSNHRLLLPATLLWGGVTALACHWISLLPGTNGLLPINTITPLLGVPMAFYVIIRTRR